MSKRGTLAETLRKALTQQPGGTLAVAYSGGPDSTALLHALAHLTEARKRGLRALHVDHRLQPDSGNWAAHCATFCAALSVPLTTLQVAVSRDSGKGIEAAARDARYAALANELRPGELLLTAQHRDDQAETVLLKLLRGAGPEGLAGMRARRPLGSGQLWRPLLDTPRKQLLDYVGDHQLPVLTDPSNADPRLSRSVLRTTILPALAAHWPHAVDSILHSAAHQREVVDALRPRWLAEFERVHDAATGSLDAPAWQALQPALRNPVLDHWLHGRHLPAPSTAQRAQILRQLHAADGRVPCVRWGGVNLHIWKQRLWLQRVHPPIDPQWETSWRGEVLNLPDGGQLSSDGASIDPPLTVRLRRGGERLKPAGDRHTRDLRDLFQTGQLPPWQRAACPLIYRDDELIAVADRWINEAGRALFDKYAMQLRWCPGE